MTIHAYIGFYVSQESQELQHFGLVQLAHSFDTFLCRIIHCAINTSYFEGTNENQIFLLHQFTFLIIWYMLPSRLLRLLGINLVLVGGWSTNSV